MVKIGISERKALPPPPLPSPLGDYVIIRHASESWHPGIRNYSIKLQLDSGACPVLDTGFAYFPHYDTVSRGGGDGWGGFSPAMGGTGFAGLEAVMMIPKILDGKGKPNAGFFVDNFGTHLSIVGFD